MENSHHLSRVESRHGQTARDLMLEAARTRGYHLRCSGKSFVPHVQFRRAADERPYPYSLSLNRINPVVYVRRPTEPERRKLLSDYKDAHVVQGGEVKVPIYDVATVQRLINELL